MELDADEAVELDADEAVGRPCVSGPPAKVRVGGKTGRSTKNLNQKAF